MQRNQRHSDYPIDQVFLDRWSPRSFSGEVMPLEALLTMLEAARWAASSYNSQPWRFVYALRATTGWEKLFGLLVPFNQEWARHASALVFAISKQSSVSSRTGEEHALPTHSFDTGAACAYMVLQAFKMGWHAHGMVGFDHERARTLLQIPDGMSIEACFAIGRIADRAKLPEALKDREMPSARLPLEDLIFEGSL